MAEPRYDAFISYSHAADGRLAPALQAGLQRLARPWYRPRALRVFRDDTGLAVNPALWDSIAAALDSSRFFIVLLSPDAAASPWVNREIEQWLATKDPMAVLPVLTEGTLVWGGADTSTALPPALRGPFTEEPRHLDLRWAREEGQLDLSNGRFREAVADLAAPLHGIPKDELEGEDLRQHRRTRRLARGAVALLAVLLAVSLVAGVLAVVNARDADRNAARAEREATVATARRLAAEAVARAGTAPDQALLLALEARRLEDSAESRSALLTVLQRTSRLEHLKTDLGAGETVAGLSEDAATVAVADTEGRVRLFDATSDEEVAHFSTDQQGPVEVEFGPDGRTVATTSDDHSVRIWRDGAPVTAPLTGHGYPVRAADFSPDGRLLATYDAFGLSVVWDTSTGQVVTRLPEMDVGPDQAIAFSPDGTSLALSGLGTTVFDLGSRRARFEMPAHALAADVTVAFSADGAWLAVDSGAFDAVEVWDLGSGRMVRTLPSGTTVVRSLAFSPDGTRLAQGSDDGAVTVWDLSAGEPTDRALVGHSGGVTHLAFGADPATLVTAASTGVARWHVDPDRQALTLRYDSGPFPIAGVDFSPDAHTIVTNDLGGSVTFLEASRLQPLGAPLDIGDLDTVGQVEVALSDDGRFALATNRGRLLYIDARSREVTRPPLELGLFGASKVRIPAEEDVAAVGGGTGDVSLIDVEGWSVTRTIGHAYYGPLFGMDISPDGRVVASGGADGRLTVDAARGGQGRAVATGRGPIGGVSFSSDGATLAVGFADGAIVLVDVATGRSTGPPLEGDVGNPAALRFSPSGRMLAVAQLDGSVVLWDVATRQRLGQLIGHARAGRIAGANNVAFAPDGRSLATVGNDGSVVLWDLDLAHWARRACDVAGRNLSRAEWREFLGDRRYRRTCPA